MQWRLAVVAQRMQPYVRQLSTSGDAPPEGPCGQAARQGRAPYPPSGPDIGALQVQAGSLASQTAAAGPGAPAAVAGNSPAWQAPMPESDEHERLAVLYALDMADRPMPPEAQQIVELASQVCEVSTRHWQRSLSARWSASCSRNSHIPASLCQRPAESCHCEYWCCLQSTAANAAAPTAEEESVYARPVQPAFVQQWHKSGHSTNA